jgi:hypothetical protein
MVESKLVELVVAGSSPVGHPILQIASESGQFSNLGRTNHRPQASQARAEANTAIGHPQSSAPKQRHRRIRARMPHRFNLRPRPTFPRAPKLAPAAGPRTAPPDQKIFHRFHPKADSTAAGFASSRLCVENSVALSELDFFTIYPGRRSQRTCPGLFFGVYSPFNSR